MASAPPVERTGSHTSQTMIHRCCIEQLYQKNPCRSSVLAMEYSAEIAYDPRWFPAG